MDLVNFLGWNTQVLIMSQEMRYDSTAYDYVLSMTIISGKDTFLHVENNGLRHTYSTCYNRFK